MFSRWTFSDLVAVYPFLQGLTPNPQWYGVKWTPLAASAKDQGGTGPVQVQGGSYFVLTSLSGTSYLTDNVTIVNSSIDLNLYESATGTNLTLQPIPFQLCNPGTGGVGYDLPFPYLCTLKTTLVPTLTNNDATNAVNASLAFMGVKFGSSATAANGA